MLRTSRTTLAPYSKGLNIHNVYLMFRISRLPFSFPTLFAIKSAP